MESKKILKYALIGIIIICIAIWANQYFGQQVFHINMSKYKEASSTENVTIYTTSHASDIKLTTYQDYKEIKMNGERYIVKKEQSLKYEQVYSVLYPSGKYYTVENINNFLVPLDEQGDMYFGTVIYVDNERMLGPEDEYYHPSDIVSIAYDEYHVNQGEFTLFVISMLFFIFSWLLFRVRAVQMFFFYLSHRMDVVDPEPSDYYFVSTKLGAILGMIASIVIFIMSLK